MLGLDWSYEAIERTEPELEGFLGSRGDEWLGFSLTMPLKSEGRRIARELDPVAVESGVVNTLRKLPEGAWAGYNTDVAGLAAAIRKAELDVTSTWVIGSGATAVSAIMAARSLGARHVEVVARNVQAVSDLVARFGGEGRGLHMSGTPLERASASLRSASRPTLVISTLPGPAAATIALSGELMQVPLFDVAYDPWPSPLAERWRAAGGVATPGTEMLVEQALVQVRIFTSGDPELPLDREEAVLAAMRAAV